MMSRLLPYPLLTASLILMWLLLNSFTLGHLVLGAIIALIATHAMTALEPSKPKIRRWSSILILFASVFIDIAQSNIAVIRLIFGARRNSFKSGFVLIPLELQDRTGLAVLACIITSTPGTSWVEYNSKHSTILIHVLDLVDEQEWIDTIKQRYESRLKEIFE